MMKLIDILMILLSPLLDTLPFALPRYWLFRDRLRLPFRYIVLLQSILAAIYSVVFYAINRGGYAAAEQWTPKIYFPHRRCSPLKCASGILRPQISTESDRLI